MNRKRILLKELKLNRGGVFAIISIIAVFFMASCIKKPDGLDGTKSYFISQETPGLYVEGDNIFGYKEADCQISTNMVRKSIRMQQDDQSSYINLLFSSIDFNSGKPIGVKLDYLTDKDKRSTSLSLSVVKSSEDKLWLWSEEVRTGVILFKINKAE